MEYMFQGYPDDPQPPMTEMEKIDAQFRAILQQLYGLKAELSMLKRGVVQPDPVRQKKVEDFLADVQERMDFFGREYERLQVKRYYWCNEYIGRPE